jgi:DNA-binding transcriptional MerR regulator
VSDDEALLQIGEVAERVGLSLRTVRYYEEVGLISPSARSDGNFRLYSVADVERLLTVKSMRPLGLSVEEMIELARLLEAAEQATVSTAGLDELVAKITEYARRSDERIDRADAELAAARRLRVRIAESAGRCEVIRGLAGE